MSLSNFKVFSKIVLWWVDAPFFKEKLRFSKTGEGIAVLKTMIAITLEADFQDRLAKISFSELENLTGLSRPMVNRAIKILTDEKLIAVHSSARGKSNIYQILDFPNTNLPEIKTDEIVLRARTKGWSKLPYQPVSKNLRFLPNKGAIALGALKNYLVMLKYRDNNADYSRISHDKFIAKCGIQANKIKSSNDLLINHNFIGLAKYIQNGYLKTSANMYYIKGIYPGKKGIEQQNFPEIRDPNIELN
ncbi:hypothetical protein QM259_15270 [Acinetobacter baumannii]|uniref:hypothetical protein n=1 Tax=Acinetobacter baumannii TaxID=470 RepID=UPI0024B7ABCC|nr:hypothetical protein [Acinetobacter baumannii]MDI9733625.1 hypothetical protein [Acinetobacter baumannii]